jgi:hypothetical protein
MMPAFIVLIVAILMAMQYKQLKSFVSPRPMEMATVPESPQSQEQVRAKLRHFLAEAPAAPGQAPARPGNRPDTLELSAEDVTHLIRSSSSLADLRLDYHIDMKDSLLVARNSLPVAALREPLATLAKVMRVTGYLNSEMQGYPALEDGKVIIVPVSAIMNGMPAPVSVLDVKGKLDLRAWVSDKDFYDRALAELADIKIRGGRLLLIKRS